ncbi:penicillin-binding transpeptidase domain-containing protein [Proteiniclasticum ruminis]|uniref:Penicillin-binding protein n=1 Tax=Proteiniclasticum ruminis TaxID=398199 RepID=A0A1I4XQV4_9CLOT|nr:penicillin-binding transpeptidase domain-containing protein [Proteiniclasticum ruminis]SFN28231.1 penicillin-binding protein [Proteiniclasticum ruminis]
MKKLLLLLMGVSLITFSGCSKEEPHDPMETFYAYQSAFENQDFETMYELLDEESRRNLNKEEYVERYESLYESVPLTDTKLEPRMEIFDIEKKLKTEDSMKVPVNLSMKKEDENITYSFDATLVKEVNEEEKAYYRIAFDPLLVYRNYQLTDTIEVEEKLPERGEIFDRNGKGLAVNGELLWVGMVPGRIIDHEAAVSALSEALGLSVEHIDKRLSLDWVKEDTFVDMKRVSYEELEKFESLRLQYPGITYRVIKGRVYPYKEAAAHLVGYVGLVSQEEYEQLKPEGFPIDTRVGRSGLESLYEEELRGEVSRSVHILDAAGKVKETLKVMGEAKGKDLHLHIDIDAQRALLNELGEDRGTASLVNYKTGEVLALVNAPSYDPNAFVLGLSQEEYSALQEDPDKPLLNRYTRLYVPGSVVKPLTAAIALETQGFDPDDTISGTGDTWQKDSSWGSYSVRRIQSPGIPIDLRKAMIYSDNIYFAQTALKIGEENLIKGLERFGIGDEDSTGLGFMTSQISNDGTLSSEIRLADTGYGQGQMLFHALTLPRAYTAIADGGLLKELMIVNEERRPKETTVITEATADTVRSYMRDVIVQPEGSGHQANLPGRVLSGKTGTAEVGSGDTYLTLGWFSVIEESESSPYITTMMVEDMKDRGLSGYVVEKVKRFITTYGQ